LKILIQFLITECVSFSLFASQGHWVAGLIGPLWGFVVPIIAIAEFFDPSRRSFAAQWILASIVLMSLFALVLLGVLGRIRRLWAHAALGAFNGLSCLLLLGIK
jgi:hypothetical protein